MNRKEELEKAWEEYRIKNPYKSYSDYEIFIVGFKNGRHVGFGAGLQEAISFIKCLKDSMTIRFLDNLLDAVISDLDNLKYIHENERD